MPVDFTPFIAAIVLWITGVIVMYRVVEKILSDKKYAHSTWWNAETPVVPLFWTILGSAVWGVILLVLIYVYEWLLGLI